MGFCSYGPDNDTEKNGPGADLHVNFGLSRNGDEIGLFTPSGELVDSVAFGPQGDDESDGSWPDGADNMLPMTPPTPGSANSVLIIIEAESQGGSILVDAAVTSGNVYRVEYNESLFGTNWMLLNIITADMAMVSFTDTNAVYLPSRFYRLTEN